MTHLLNIDPPDHTRLRRLVSKAFTPRRVAEFAPRVQELTDRLIDNFIEEGSADLIHDFAFPLPIYAICDLLGVPREDQDDFRDWAGMMIRHGGGPRGGVARSVKKMRGYLAELIHRKRENPGDDLISGLIRASDHGEHLTENEAAAMAFILLFAGFETTVNLIGNGVYALLRNPEQRERLQRSLDAGETGLLETGIEELLRYDGPVELATWRFATEPLVLGGQRISAGDPVLVVLAAADRDPERFADPDTLDLSRRDNQHLGYGHGIHYCLGAPLARLEGQAALATLLRRLPDLRLAVEPTDLRWRGGSSCADCALFPWSSIPDIAPVKVTLCQLRDFHVICAASTCDKRSTAATFTVRLTSHLSVTRKATPWAPRTADTVALVRHPPSSSPQASPARPSPSRCSARPVRTRPTPRPGTGSPSARAAACGVPISATASTAVSSSRRTPGSRTAARRTPRVPTSPAARSR